MTQGSGELGGILSAAAGRAQLVLVDFSASWCGPCRMMLPVLQQLASEHRGRLAVVKVDCEQTAANQELARSAGIRGFPTFHLYRNQQKVAEKVGADPAGLRRAILEQLTLLGAPPSGAGPGPMAAALAAALGRVKAGCSFEEFVAAAKTLLVFVGNVLDHPGEERYRRVKAGNAAFQSKLGCRPGGKECMQAIGFRELVEAGEPVLAMTTPVPAELPRIREQLQQALRHAEAAAAGAAAAERRAASGIDAAPRAAPAVGTAVASPASAAAAPAARGAAGASAQLNSAGSVDAAALARALAAAMTPGAVAFPTSLAVAPGGTGLGSAQGPQHRPRILKVTPRGLARTLAQAMSEAGIGVTAAHQQQQQQQEPPQPDQ